jgi:hypothetical protein
VRLSDPGIELGEGSVLGEIGLFSPEHCRTSTAICQTECELRTVSAADETRLYYHEPEFAMYRSSCSPDGSNPTRSGAGSMDRPSLRPFAIGLLYWRERHTNSACHSHDQ